MESELLTIREAGRRLGLREKTLRRWVSLRKIEYIRAGERAVRISSVEIDRLIESGRVPRITRPAPTNGSNVEPCLPGGPQRGNDNSPSSEVPIA
jgi:excisionase family DNA binding protein